MTNDATIDNNKNNKNDYSNIPGTGKINSQSIETIGEAIKEAAENKEEVIVEGPTSTMEHTNINESSSSNIKEGFLDKDNDAGIVLPVDQDNNSEISIEAKDNSKDTLKVEDKINIGSGNIKETAVNSITTIPVQEKVKVEVDTEVDLRAEDNDIGSRSKVNIDTNALTTEIPTAKKEQQQRKPNSNETKKRLLSGIKELEKGSYNTNLDFMMNMFTDNIEKMAKNYMEFSHLFNRINEQQIQFTENISNRYNELQRESSNLLYNTLNSIFENTNILFQNNQIYFQKLSEVALIYTNSRFTSSYSLLQ